MVYHLIFLYSILISPQILANGVLSSSSITSYDRKFQWVENGWKTGQVRVGPKNIATFSVHYSLHRYSFANCFYLYVLFKY